MEFSTSLYPVELVDIKLIPFTEEIEAYFVTLYYLVQMGDLPTPLEGVVQDSPVNWYNSEEVDATLLTVIDLAHGLPVYLSSLTPWEKKWFQRLFFDFNDCKGVITNLFITPGFINVITERTVYVSA